MRRNIIGGNWKMNKNQIEGAETAFEIAEGLKDREPPCEVILFPPFTAIPSVIESIGDSRVRCGGQNMHYEDSGAFTGEISGGMLKSLGCRYVLVGHSERRHIFNEGPDLLKRKIEAAFRSGLLPVYCVGELLEEREQARADEVVEAQLREVLSGLGEDQAGKLILAYEPVWAIGTGKTATPSDAEKMHSFIREVLESIFGKSISDELPIMYGGSVKPGNAADLLSEKNIDGALVGGASLNAGSFLDIIFALS